jgi:hypothetical protein
MIKVIAIHQSQGFRGKYWAKDEPTEIAEGEDFPKEHFKRADGKPWEDDDKAAAKAAKEAEKLAAKEKAEAEKAEKERLAAEAKAKAEAEKAGTGKSDQDKK